MTELPLVGCQDVGTLEAYLHLENSKYRCRPYNHIEVLEDSVVKPALRRRHRALSPAKWTGTSR